MLQLHSDKIAYYKRLLERAQAASSAQLHALQAEIRMIKTSSPREGSFSVDVDEVCTCGAQKKKGRGSYWSGTRFYHEEEADGEEDVDLATALRDFDEKVISRTVKRLKREKRNRLSVGIPLPTTAQTSDQLQAFRLSSSPCRRMTFNYKYFFCKSINARPLMFLAT